VAGTNGVAACPAGAVSGCSEEGQMAVQTAEPSTDPSADHVVACVFACVGYNDSEAVLANECFRVYIGTTAVTPRCGAP
jgi:hypothetical protein